MKKYRVLMEDTVNGQAFNFALHYHAASMNDAADLALAEFGDEFGDVIVREARQVPPTLQELLGAVK